MSEPVRIWAWGEHAGNRSWHDEEGPWEEYIRKSALPVEDIEQALHEYEISLGTTIVTPFPEDLLRRILAVLEGEDE